MPDWRAFLRQAQERLRRLPKLFWAIAGVLVAALGIVAWAELSGPPYAVLSEGLAPADGGKVIAQLQKLGIPYQLQAAGNVILVPAPQLAQARLQLGEAQVPGSDVGSAWDKLEQAPMTASSLAQTTMATQALQLSLQRSIEGLNGVRAAQVFLAVPPDTPFLADQPKPSAAVVIQADDAAAEAQGQAIANLVAGAVPGLGAGQVTVQTTSGVTVYPVGKHGAAGWQLATVASVENSAAARVAALLAPLVGAGNFQTDVSAALDFTQERVHQVSYGPTHLLSHEETQNSSQWGDVTQPLGIPGALSNEPPGATVANPSAANGNASAAAGTGNNAGNAGGAANAANGAGAPGGKSAAKPEKTAPLQVSSHTDRDFLTDQSERDITAPDWSVKSVAISVVLNQAALGKVTTEQVKAAIAGAFAYPQVNVSVLAASFQKAPAPLVNANAMQALAPVLQALLELMAAAALLFGLALPIGRRLSAVNLNAVLPPPPPRPMPVVLPPRDFSELRDQAAENIPGVARLLQAWAEDSE